MCSRSKITHVGVHGHEYGSSVYLFSFEGEGMPSAEEAIEVCGADVEPEKGEDFELTSVHEDDVYRLTRSGPMVIPRADI